MKKKITAIILILVLIIGIIVGNKFFKTNYENLTENNKILLDDLNRLYENTDEEIWKGFDIKSLPVLFVEKGEKFNFGNNTVNLIRKNALGLNLENMEDKWYASEINNPYKSNLGDIYRVSSLYPKSFKTLNPMGNFLSIGSNMDIGNNKNVYMIKYNSKNIDNNKASKNIIPFYIHELFHYTLQENWNINDEEIIINNDIDYLELLGLEYYILDDIKDNLDSREDLEKSLIDYILVSEKRKKLDENQFIKEKYFETIEGTATYVAMISSEKIDKPFTYLEGGKKVEDRYFKNLFNIVGNYDGYLDELKWARYDSGALITKSLDKLNIDYQDKINRDNTIYDEVKNYIVNNHNLEKIEIRDIYDLENIKKDALKIKDKLN